MRNLFTFSVKLEPFFYSLARDRGITFYRDGIKNALEKILNFRWPKQELPWQNVTDIKYF